MGQPFYVNGPASLQYAGAQLGYGVDGVEVEYDIAHNDVKFDVAGGTAGKAGDVQFMNVDATISVSLTAINWPLLQSAMSNAVGGGSYVVAGPSGVLLGANGFLKPVNISSSLGGRPLTFPACYLISPLRIPLGTVNSIIGVVFRSIIYSGGADTLQGGVLSVNQ